MENTYVVIMAGGIGSRFWPESRVAMPKQFLDILNTGKTLIQLTYERFLPICPMENILIVTSEEYVPIVKSQLPELKDEQILREPIRRNTAPCIAYACDKILASNKDANVIVSPADHLILHPDKFIYVLAKSLDFVEQNDALITLGIKPNKPSTGYGYIQYTTPHEQNSEVFKVKTFTEKPNLDLAKTFLESGDFLWNSGMFVWRASTLMNAVKKYLPEIADAFRDGAKHYNTPNEADFIKTVYSQCTNISIDFGVMEKADNVYIIPASFGWSDIGSWDSLYEVYPKDYLGNAVSGNHVKVYDASNNMVMVSKEKLVVIEGLDGYCIIDSGDVLLICNRTKEQEIKQITIDLKRSDLDRFL